MKRLVPVVAALTLVAAACGGGNDTADDATDDTASEATADATADISSDEPSIDEATSTEEPTDTTDDPDDTATTDDVDPSDADDTDDTTTDDTGSAETDGDGADTDEADTDDADTDSDDAGDSVTIRSMDDVPPACQDEMAEFLQALEPIVSPIDWQNATMAEFEQIANDFQEEADAFQAASASAGCDDLVFDAENEGQILVEFARREAPGAVGFLEFLELMRTSATPTDDGAAAEAGIETCQDAIDFLQGLMDTYATMSEVPAAELMKIPSIATVSAQCTPEELAFFENPDLQVFMGE